MDCQDYITEPAQRKKGQFRIVREVSGIANNINQIARLANTVKSVSPAQVEELQRLCSEVLSLVRESL